MELHLLKPKKALNKAFLKVKPNRTEIQNFKAKDRKSTRLNSSHVRNSYAVFCLKKNTDLDQNLIADIRASGIWRANFGHTAVGLPPIRAPEPSILSAPRVSVADAPRSYYCPAAG